ncbi:unnamed protein product [Heligmosomoides polygyrus]|uniref:Uncharacterized protein n=1 Tax=Heligmosomoides polygyrus TaxID=6339 RepID=A0A183FG99_HELPZ|nr:unnamed protein product [Heligmosomoides polygyrus]
MLFSQGSGRRRDFTNISSLSMLENPTQNSAAAYTASWVSSTSSIPPELRDEPEVGIGDSEKEKISCC